MNSEETFDATEELRNLNKNNSGGTSGDKKKRAKTIFGMSFGDAPLNNQVLELNHELGLHQYFFQDDNVNWGQQQHFTRKKHSRAGKKDIV